MSSIIKSRSRFRCKGISLIQLMVSIVIGLMLTIVVVQLFLGSKESYRLQQGLSSMQESGRLAVYVLRDSIQMAGFPQYMNISPLVDTTTVDKKSDELTIQFYSDTDCLGNDITNIGNIAINKFYVDNESLMCLGNGSRDAIPLMEGILQMQVVYGVDDDLDGVANRYQNATTVDAESNWDQIVSIRVALLAKSDDVVKPKAETRRFVLLDEKPISITSRHVHRVFTVTYPIRNRML